MRGSPGGNHAAQVPGHDDIGICPADPGLGPLAERVHPAGAHDADPAGQPHVAETALGLLGVVTVPHGLHIVSDRFVKQLIAIAGH
jgi:hypothetical protein